MAAPVTWCGVLVPAVLVALAGAPAAAQPALQQLGFLGSSGPSIGYGISADGHVVVGQSLTDSDGFRAFRWTAVGGMQNLGAFDNGEDLRSSIAYAANADGSVVVGASVRPGSLNENGSPFRWTSAGGMEFLGSLGGTEGGDARGINGAGTIIVGSSSSVDFDYRAYHWVSPGPMTPLALVANQQNAGATGVSSDGRVIVGMAANAPVVWTQSGAIATVLPGLAQNAFGGVAAVTPDGLIFAGFSAGRACRWVNNTPQNLGTIAGGVPQTVYFASAISADGSVIVGLGNYNAGLGTGNPFIWDAANGIRDLNLVAAAAGVNLNGFQMFYPMAISADGLSIAGYGFSATDQEAFLLDLHAGAPACYANCDGSTASPVLNVADFTCFLQRCAAGDPYANCDASTSQPTLNVADFTCFLQKFAAGCP